MKNLDLEFAIEPEEINAPEDKLVESLAFQAREVGSSPIGSTSLVEIMKPYASFMNKR